MARFKCPACGQPYNGKRCGSCFYENFSDEISCSEHHKETVFDREPSARKQGYQTFTKEKTYTQPTAKPAASRPYTATTTKTGSKKKAPVNRVVRILAVIYGIVILVNVASGLFAAGVRESAVSSFNALAQPEPEPEVIMPAGGTVLYDDGSLLIKADWENGDTYTQRIPIYVQNNTDQDLNVSTQDVYVNGYLLDVSYMSCDAERGETAMSTLRLNEDSMVECGIETVAEITFSLFAYDTASFDTYGESGIVTLTADTPTGFVQPVDDSGELLWEAEGFRVVYRGYRAAGYSSEAFLDGTLQFFIENNTDRSMEFCVAGSTINGGEAELFFWQELLPGTRTVADMYLYSLAELDIDSPDDIQSLEVQLEAQDSDDWEYVLTTKMIPLDIGE